MIAGTAERRKATRGEPLYGVTSLAPVRALDLRLVAPHRPRRGFARCRPVVARGPAGPTRLRRSHGAPHRRAAARAGRPVVVRAPGADRSGAPPPAADRQGAELGPHRRSTGVGPGHGCLHAGAGPLAAVLCRSRLPPRRPAAGGRWPHLRPARPRQHQRVRSCRGCAAGGAGPAAVAYGQTLVVTTPGVAAVTKVTLIQCRFSVPPNDYLASTAVPPRFGRDL